MKKRIHPIPANIRKQQHILHTLKIRNPTSSPSIPAERSISSSGEVLSRRTEQLEGVCRRFPPSHRSGRKPASSISSVGDVLCCSSLNSSDIRTCNKRFIKQFDHDVACKVWKGVVDLGVEGGYFKAITKVGERRGSNGVGGQMERPFLQGINFNTLSVDDNALLLEPFSEEEVDFERAYDTVSWRFLEQMMIKMGFSEGWLKWMRACVFQSSTSILINGSPTEDFMVGRGLRQGDPLSPFLFLIAVEGLTGLMRKAVEIGKFKGYRVSDCLQFPILQFADDTILLGNGSWDNLWKIKILLRSFELVLGLKINFVKSKLCGLNVDPNLLGLSSKPF
ncbi:hypothetical protein TSUD_371240 [Trifolium subterraneum]|uniref:Reverse transcriptase domain-containing protein n=1 Tax=Trifolium subterraneum TaxID=3900 RepID=A0A2Z6P5P0_TRISU|nr:hypothetical protein TSUD_371240 [Trifolium subterraneum]